VNSIATLLAVVFLAVAALDWAAVHSGHRRLRWLTKPGCMIALIASAAAMDPVDESARTALLVALALSTLGDVFLLGDRSNLFVAGLASFLLAHVAYVAGFWLEGVDAAGVVAGILLGVVLVGTVGARVAAAAKAGPEPGLAGPVRAYVVVIALMVASAVGTGDLWAIAGAALFAISDSLIAWERFIRTRPWADLAIIVTYHLAQLLLVISFV
jgi:uncharacterized membrane protein YhhN